MKPTPGKIMVNNFVTRILPSSGSGTAAPVALILIGLLILLAASHQAAAQPINQTWIYDFPADGLGDGRVHDLVVTGDGRVVVVGHWNYTWGVVCLDLETGELLWQMAGDVDYQHASAVVLVPDGTNDVIIGGYQQYYGPDAFLARLDPNGDAVWTRLVVHVGPGLQTEAINDLALLENDRVYGCGEYASLNAIGYVTTTDPYDDAIYVNLPEEMPKGNVLLPTSSTTGIVAGKFFTRPGFNGKLVHINMQCEILWEYLDDGITEIHGLARTTDGRIIYAGFLLDLAGTDQARVGAVSATGEPLWQINQGVDYISLFRDVCPAEPGGSNSVYVCGQVVEEMDGPNRQLVHKINPAGDIEWTLYGADSDGSGNEWSAVAALPDGGLVVAGKHIISYANEEIVIERYDP